MTKWLRRKNCVGPSFSFIDVNDNDVVEFSRVDEYALVGIKTAHLDISLSETRNVKPRRSIEQNRPRRGNAKCSKLFKLRAISQYLSDGDYY